MGAVYLATQVQLERSIAVKLVRPSVLKAHPGTTKRFMKEAAALSKLVHPNIATVYDYGRTVSGQLYVAMERLHGHSLGEVVGREGPLSFRRIVRLGLQIGRALRSAHAVGIVHRDLTPADVMLVRGPHDEDQDHVKVLDLGLAKVLTPDNGIDLSGDVGVRADIYAFGCLMFFMVTGQPPIKVDGADVVTSMRLRMPVPEPADVGYRRDCPRQIERVIAKCLEKQPGDRYDSIGDVLTDLKSALGTLPRGVSASSPVPLENTPWSDEFAAPAPPRAPTPTQMYASPPPVAEAPPPLAAPFIDESVQPAPSVTNEYSSPDLLRPPKQSRLPMIIGVVALLIAIIGASFAVGVAFRDEVVGSLPQAEQSE